MVTENDRRNLINLLYKSADARLETPAIGNHPEYMQPIKNNAEPFIANRHISIPLAGGSNIYGSHQEGGAVRNLKMKRMSDIINEVYKKRNKELHSNMSFEQRQRLLQNSEAPSANEPNEIYRTMPIETNTSINNGGNLGDAVLHGLSEKVFSSLVPFLMKKYTEKKGGAMVQQNIKNILSNMKSDHVGGNMDMPLCKCVSGGCLECKKLMVHNNYGDNRPNTSPPILTTNQQENLYNQKVNNDSERKIAFVGSGIETSTKKVKNPARVAAAKEASKNNSWFNHVKEMAKSMNISYGEAISNKHVKDTYNH
jgi:hypothetical protein